MTDEQSETLLDTDRDSGAAVDGRAVARVQADTWAWSVIGLAALSGALLSLPFIARRWQGRGYRRQSNRMDDYIQDNLAQHHR